MAGGFVQVTEVANFNFGANFLLKKLGEVKQKSDWIGSRNQRLQIKSSR